MNKDLMITQQDLIDWIDRPPSNDDLDLATFILTRLEKLEDYEEQVRKAKLCDEKDKEIERLKEELEYTIPIVEHNKTITKHLKENKRLNNIINELEIELYAKYHEHKDSECEELYAKAQEDKEILDYIKELKGSAKE